MSGFQILNRDLSANAATFAAPISGPTLRRHEWASLLLPERERKAHPVCDFFNSPLISD
jgi:hypothetical protein